MAIEFSHIHSIKIGHTISKKKKKKLAKFRKEIFRQHVYATYIYSFEIKKDALTFA